MNKKNKLNILTAKYGLDVYQIRNILEMYGAFKPMGRIILKLFFLLKINYIFYMCVSFLLVSMHLPREAIFLHAIYGVFNFMGYKIPKFQDY